MALCNNSCHEEMHDMRATCKESLDLLSPPHSHQIGPNQKCQPEPIIMNIIIIVNARYVIFNHVLCLSVTFIKLLINQY